MRQSQNAVFIHDKVATELGSVVAVRIKELTALKPPFDVHPHHARMP
jgi:hypothetical protein